MRYSLIIISEYLIESNQNSVHHLSCQAVRRTAYLKFCSGCMLKGFGLRTYLLDTEGWGPGLKILALTTSVIKIQCKSKFSLSCAHRSHKLLNHSIFVPPAAIYSLFHGFSSIRTAVAPSLSLDQRLGTCSKTVCVSRTCKLTVFVVHWRRLILISTRHSECIWGIFLRWCAI